MRIEVWDALAEVIGAAPDRSQRPQARLIEHLEHVEVRVDRLGAFEVNDRGQCAVAHARLDVIDGPHHAQLSVGFALKTMQDAELSEGGPLGIPEFKGSRQLDRRTVHLAERRTCRWRRLRIGRNVHRKQAAGKAAFTGTRQVDVTLIAALEKAAASTAQPGRANRALLSALRLEQA